MRVLRLDDAYGWCVAGRGFRVVVDPWLVESEAPTPELGHPTDGRAALAADALDAPDVVLLTSDAEPHCHLVTLAQLPAPVRVVGPAAAVRRARSVGVRSTIELAPDAEICLDGRIRIAAQATRGRAGRGALAYRLTAEASGHSVHLDTHRPRRVGEARLARADALIVAADAMRVLGRLLTPDALEAVELARALEVDWILPTVPPYGLASATMAERLARPGTELRLLRALAKLHLPRARVARLRPGQSVNLASAPAAPAATAKRPSRRRTDGEPATGSA